MQRKFLRFLLVAGVFFLLAGLLVFSQQSKPPVIVSRTDPPKISFEEDLHEMGTVMEGTEVSHVFKINNVGGEPLIINNVSTSCGCTLLNLKDKRIEPGKTGEMEVVMDTSMKQGYVKKEIDVFSNDPEKPKKTVYLAVNVIPSKTASAESTKTVSGKTVPQDPHMGLSFNPKEKAKIFTGRCATCHVNEGKGKKGEGLYQADCAMCHGKNAEGAVGPALVPGDYHNEDFINRIQKVTRYGSETHASMPGFLQDAGGPLTDEEINSIVIYLQNKSNKIKSQQQPEEIPVE